MAATVFNVGKTALITGGASGIGLAVAKKCLDRGMKALIADKNKSLLDEAKKSLGESILTFEMDVGRLNDWEQLHQYIAQTLEGRVDFLLLNAGTQYPSNWQDSEPFRATFDVNFFGVVNGITTMLPTLKAQAASRIVITGSKQGITNPPGNPAYNASKAALKAVAEHLSYDLRETSTTVHLLVPGWTFTGLTRGPPAGDKSKPAGAWTAAQVADFMEERMGKGDFYIVCPDNEVTEEMDKKRMLWTAGDIVHGRPPLSRWRGEFKDQVSDWMANSQVD